MTIHKFEVGDSCFIINRSISGKYFLEGDAEIMRLIGKDHTYAVRFGGCDTSIVDRYIDPDLTGRKEIQDHIDSLNHIMGANRFKL